MIAYVIRMPWTSHVLLDDGTWGDDETYQERAEVFSCRVKAQRRAAKDLNTGWTVAVCPWEMPDEPQPSTEEDLEDSPKPPTPPESSAQPSLSVPRSVGLF